MRVRVAVPLAAALSLAGALPSSAMALEQKLSAADGAAGDELGRSVAIDGDTAGGGVRNRLLGGKGNDRLTAGPGRDLLYGGGGNDRLTGDGGNDVLKGRSGNDKLSGGAGRNRYAGDAGNIVSARNRRRDVVYCGAGRDKATVDRFDKVCSCERVRAPVELRR